MEAAVWEGGTDLRVRVPEDVLAEAQQRRLDLGVDGQLAGVDDAHVHSGADGVVEEDRVHGLADGLHAAEGERDVADAAADAAARTRRLDQPRRLDERHAFNGFQWVSMGFTGFFSRLYQVFLGV